MTFRDPPSWKILNKLDKPGEVIVRKMTPEEVEKYGKANEVKPVQGYRWKREEKGMRIGEVTTAQILEVCVEHGTGVEAQQIIADKYNVDRKAVSKTIWNRKIKEKLEALKEMENRLMEGEGIKEPVGILSEVEKPQHNDALDALVHAFQNKSAHIEMAMEKPRLKPKTLQSQAIDGMEYIISGEVLRIDSDSVIFDIAIDSLHDLIQDLQEVEKIAKG